MNALLLMLALIGGLTESQPSESKRDPVPLPGASDADREIAGKMIGTWQVLYEDPERRKRSIAWTVYAANGMASSRSVTNSGAGEINLVLEAQWTISNGFLVTKVTKSSDAKIVKVGSVTKDRITAITQQQLRYVDEDGKTIIEQRVVERSKK